MDKYRYQVKKGHRQVIREYIILIQNNRTPTGKSLRQFANRTLNRGWYNEEDKEILNSMRFDVIQDRKRKLKENGVI